MSKGCWRRPTKVDRKTFEERWSKIFGGERKDSTEGESKAEDGGEIPPTSTKQ